MCDFEIGTRAFRVSVGIEKSKQIRTQLEKKKVKLLLRWDARVNNVEAETDTLADQLAKFIFILKKGTINSYRITLPRSRAVRGQLRTAHFVSSWAMASIDAPST